MKIPFFPFYASDWLGSRKVMLMTDAQRGIYITLMAHQWSDPSCSIPTDRELLKKMLPGSRWKNVKYVLQECFIVEGLNGERARNERINVEHSKAIGKSLKAKWAVKCREELKKERTNDERTMNERSSPQNQNQIQNHIEEEAGQKPKRSPTKKLTDEEWILMLKANPAYKDLDVDMVRGKLEAWCVTKGKKPTRARLLNWLNREERPLTGGNDGFQGGGGRGAGRESAFEKRSRLAREAKEQAASALGIRRGSVRLPADVHPDATEQRGSGTVDNPVIDGSCVEVPKAR